MSQNPEVFVSARIAVLVDCDNMPPDSLRFALRAMAQFGRIVVRRGYGNHGTLTAKWRESLVEYAFTPHLQFQYAAGKNTADIAMALDAVELMFDGRADAYCLVTSDSDFSYLCRKLRERGGNVYIVGERRTPSALRNASDQFFELDLLRQEYADEAGAGDSGGEAAPRAGNLAGRLADIAAGVVLLAEDSADGWVSLSALSSYIKRTDPGFDPKRYGFKRFLDMVRTHKRFETRQEGSNWRVRPKDEDRGPRPVAPAGGQGQRDRGGRGEHGHERRREAPVERRQDAGGERRPEPLAERGGEPDFEAGPAEPVTSAPATITPPAAVTEMHHGDAPTEAAVAPVAEAPVASPAATRGKRSRASGNRGRGVGKEGAAGIRSGVDTPAQVSEPAPSSVAQEGTVPVKGASRKRRSPAAEVATASASATAPATPAAEPKPAGKRARRPARKAGETAAE